MGIFTSAFSIIDKILPNQKTRLRNEIEKLEGKLAKALVSDNDIDVAIYSKRLYKLRARLHDID